MKKVLENTYSFEDLHTNAHSIFICYSLNGNKTGPCIGEMINKSWSVFTVEYYAAIKWNGLLILTTWINYSNTYAETEQDSMVLAIHVLCLHLVVEKL